MWQNCYYQVRYIKGQKAQDFKRAFNPIFEERRKNLKKQVYQHEPIAILATHQVKNVYVKDFHAFHLETKFQAPSCSKQIAQ